VTFGTPIVHYELCDSTQNIALEKLKTGSPPGTTITADAMTNGRGRSGRAWHTPERSNVCLTTIGESVAPEILWQLAPLVSLACVEALRALSHLAIHIRFPNDIYLENKKLGGILIESSVLEHQTYPLIGIGINVAQASFPEDIKYRATSLAASHCVLPLQIIQQAILTKLTERWNQWRESGFEPICASYNQHLATDQPRQFGDQLATIQALHSDGTYSILWQDGRREIQNVRQLDL
jgi:BirA family transcriptional regulator, biotin operon repressor / biotin---[acetyl-CoA-carboxylase] ligase